MRFARPIQRATTVWLNSSDGPGRDKQRKETPGCDLLQALLPKVLKPLAAEVQHPEAFYAGWRLVAIDGTQFSLRNTSEALAHTTKAAATGTQDEAAFAKINTAVLVELGTHNPLTAVCCWQGTGELTLARSCLEAVPPGSLLLADRLYGCGDFLAEAPDTLAPGGSQFIVRVKANLFKELKTHLHGMNSLLRAQRIAAGVQEIMALILAAAVVARQRMKVADGAGVSPLRVTLQKGQCANQQITL